MNKQQLSEALARGIGERTDVHWLTVHTAARLVERLLPGECEAKRCKGKYGHQLDAPCRMTGRVWDEGIVEAVAKAIFDSGLVGDDTAWDNLESDEEWIREEYRRHARAVLSALVELLTEKDVAGRPVLESIEGVDPSEYSIELHTNDPRKAGS